MVDATDRALAWAAYLETHAKRAYGAAVQADTVPANATGGVQVNQAPVVFLQF